VSVLLTFVLIKTWRIKLIGLEDVFPAELPHFGTPAPRWVVFTRDGRFQHLKLTIYQVVGLQ